MDGSPNGTRARDAGDDIADRIARAHKKGGLAVVYETLDRPVRRSQRLERREPYAHPAPVIVWRDVDGGHIVLDLTAHTIDRGPVCVTQQDGPRVNDAAYGRDVAKLHLPMRRQHHHSADPRPEAPVITIGGLIPPGMGITIDRYPADPARIGNALQAGA